MSRVRWWLLFLILAALAAFFIWGAPALAVEWETTPDATAIRAIYAEAGSPLPWWTVAAFKYTHPDFDVAGYLAIIKMESSLGTTGGSARYHNPGNIRFAGWREPGDPKVWYLWQNGSWYCRGQGTYGTYSSPYWGQRAAIRLIYQHYNAALLAGDWSAVGRYYGHGVAGCSRWIAHVRAARDRFGQRAAAYGCAW